MEVRELDAEQAGGYAGLDGQVNTVLCLNVLEYADDPESVIGHAARCLQTGGRLIVLAPQSEALFGAVDKTLGHKRRFNSKALRTMLERTGLQVERTHSINKASTPGWWLYSRLLGMKQINKISLKLFDWTVWFWRRVDILIPWPGLSVIVIARRPKS